MRKPGPIAAVITVGFDYQIIMPPCYAICQTKNDKLWLIGDTFTPKTTLHPFVNTKK
jgi:hypothetical protein